MTVRRKRDMRLIKLMVLAVIASTGAEPALLPGVHADGPYRRKNRQCLWHGVLATGRKLADR